MNSSKVIIYAVLIFINSSFFSQDSIVFLNGKTYEGIYNYEDPWNVYFEKKRKRGKEGKREKKEKRKKGKKEKKTQKKKIRTETYEFVRVRTNSCEFRGKTHETYEFPGKMYETYEFRGKTHDGVRIKLCYRSTREKIIDFSRQK